MLNEVDDFIARCVMAGMLLSSLCSIIVIPAAAWVAVRVLAPAIARMERDPLWQAPLAAAAATLPGALFLSLVIAGFVGGIQTSCLQFVGGRILIGTIALLGIAGLVRATYLAVRRTHQAHNLVAASNPPSARLKTIGEKCGLAVRELSDSQAVCVLANVLRPVALVSSSAIGSLDDEELEAALLHERAHAIGGDQIISFALMFVVDMLPLPVANLLDAYRAARELAADRRALAHTTADSLASALVTIAKSFRAVQGAASLVEHQGLQQRLMALLHPTSERPLLHYRVVVTVALFAILIGGVGGPLVSSASMLSCPKVMQMR